jgi:hypothetical protein
MQLDEKYHLFFDNRGKCPECGRMLIMSFGCVNFDCPDGKKNIFGIEDYIRKQHIMRSCLSYYVYAYDKESYFENLKLLKLKNLDKQPKKQYIKTDDSGISE